jgi:hypothetical protein
MSDCSGCNVICNTDSTCCKQLEKVKLYSQNECTNLDGIWHANGECTKKTGGSYSWDNRSKPVDPKPVDPKSVDSKPADLNQKLGKPCPEGRIQLYTKDECDALGGNWYENGECLKKTGGSYSWDNRPTNSKLPEYNVQVSLADSSHEYRSAKSVTVSDALGNVLFSTEPGKSTFL